MIRELVKEIEDYNFKVSFSYVLVDNYQDIYEDTISKQLYKYNFQKQLVERLENYSEIHIDYATLFKQFKQSICNDYNEPLYFRSTIILNFDFDELLEYDFTRLYKNLNLPELNCVFHLKDFVNCKLGLCMYVIYEDYDKIGNVDKFNSILKPIVNRYKEIITKFYSFIRHDEIIVDFTTEDGLDVFDYYPATFEAKILLAIEKPERILINKLLFDLNTI